MENDLKKYNGTWSRKQASHLIRRTMFGVTKEDADHFTAAGIDAAVDELLLTPAEPAFLPLNDYDQFGTNVIPGKTWVTKKYVKEEDEKRLHSFHRWAFGTFILQHRTVADKMYFFWHNHFATDTAPGRSDLVWKHHALLRENALGNFKTLAEKITTDPHMLRYLNGEFNAKGAPDENYARELQELFCTGKDGLHQYTEEDIRQAAKVLTGWKVNYDTGESFFDPAAHDSSDKHFSSYYNHAVIKGKQGAEAGAEEMRMLIDMIFSVKETPLFICRKLYRRFVNSIIDEETEKKVIVPMAAVMRKNNFDIKPVLRHLFTSDHFYREDLYGAQIKNPLDFCIGLQREFGLVYPSAEKYVLNYSMWEFTAFFCAEIGISFGNPPNVAGWPAWYQSPAYDQLWVNGALYPKRNDYTDTLIRYGYNREGYLFQTDLIAFAASLKSPEDPGKLIDESLSIIYSIEIDAATKQKMKKDFLLTGQESDHYWTDAWNDHQKNKEDADKKNIVLSRLTALYAFITSSPAYQLM